MYIVTKFYFTKLSIIKRSNKYVTVPWDGGGQDGNVIANGTYFYKLIVKTTDGKYNTNVIGKIAVIR